MTARQDAERLIAVQAEVIALKRKAAAWGANEDEETISAFIGRWEALANWFQSAVFYEGERYPSVEHAFQAAKAGADAVAAKAIREAATPKLAHELGRKLPLPVDWERRKRPLMQALLRDKFRRDSALHEPAFHGCASGCMTWGKPLPPPAGWLRLLRSCWSC